MGRQINWKLLYKRNFYNSICHVGLIFHLEWLWTLRRVNAGPCLLDKMLIRETEKGKGRVDMRRREKTESRQECQITTAEDQPSTQFQTGKGMWGEEKGNERLEKEVQWGKERNSNFWDIWLWLGEALWTSQPLLLVLTGTFRGSWCYLYFYFFEVTINW